MSTVEVSFAPLSAHVRTARLIAVAAARRAGLDAEVLDEVRLAVGEACSRAVERHRRGRVHEQIRISLIEEPTRFVINVSDRASTEDPDVARSGTDALAELARMVRHRGEDDSPLEPLPAGVGIAVIRELVNDLDVEVTAEGCAVRMSWPLTSAALPPVVAGADRDLGTSPLPA